MRNSLKTLIAAGLGAALAACGGTTSEDQNIAIDNIGGEDIETLPADESSATSSDGLVNGEADDPTASSAGNPSNAY